MSVSESKRKLPPAVAAVLDRLHHPLHLRVVLTAVLLGVWYFGIEEPLIGTIDSTSKQVGRERKRVELAREIEGLRAQVGKFEERIPKKTDSNEWVQYMLRGVRALHLKLILLDTETPRDLGPYKAAVVRLSLEGNYHDINAFLRWVESNPRLLRIDSLKIDPRRGVHGTLGAELTILGVMG